MDYYSVLEIDKKSSIDDIKKAYRKLAMKYHPDRNNGDKTSEKKFKEINEAYAVLSNNSKRQQYDTFGSTQGAGGFGGAGGFNVDVDISDIFESFFGGGFSGNSSRKNSPDRVGEDLEYNLNLDLKPSIYGGKEKIEFNRIESCEKCSGEGGSGKKSCGKCNGSGSITYTRQSVFGVIQQTGACDSCNGSGEKFEEVCIDCNGKKRVSKNVSMDVDIPAGIDDGMIIKMSGEGNAGTGSSSSGNLYIKFRVSLEEKGLKRDGMNLYYDLEVDILEAVLGTKKEVILPILGKREVNIKAGIDFGMTLKISGDGVKDVSSDDKGDLFIKVNIKIPKKLSKKEKQLYLEIAKEKKINVNDEKGVFEKMFG